MKSVANTVCAVMYPGRVFKGGQHSGAARAFSQTAAGLRGKASGGTTQT